MLDCLHRKPVGFSVLELVSSENEGDKRHLFGGAEWKKKSADDFEFYSCEVL